MKMLKPCVLFCLASFLSCSDDKTTRPDSDTSPPQDVDDLEVFEAADGAIKLLWTAPGDDGDAGQAARYDIRCAAGAEAEMQWEAAVVIDSMRVPKAAGEMESLVVAGLADGPWSFCLKTADEVPNWSGISNVTSAVLLPDTIPPGEVTDLAAIFVSAASIELSWTAPMDQGWQGAGSSYDLRYARVEITADNWENAIPVEGLPAPHAPGTSETFTITELEQASVYSIALKTRDTAGNESALSNVLTQTTASLRQLTSVPVLHAMQNGAFQPNWSPDGGTIAFMGDWEDGFPWNEVYAIPTSGGSPVRLTYESVRAVRNTWSPDGTRLAYSNQNLSGTTSILVMNPLPESPVVPIITGTHTQELGNYVCSWSPIEERIAYNLTVWTSDHPSRHVRSDICMVDVEDGETQTILSDNQLIYGGDWSPDGSQFVFSSTRGGKYHLWVVPATGGTPQRLTAGPGNDKHPAWSPDGSRIAYASNRTGNNEIWVFSFIRNDEAQLTFGSGSKNSPTWSPDGQALAFSIFDGASGDIWVLQWE